MKALRVARERHAVRRPRRRSKNRLLISCEHGGNGVPAAYASLFVGAERVLNTHRGLDFGALEVAEAFGARLRVKPITATTTRLVVDLNRSPYHPNLFSSTRVRWTASNAPPLDAHYWPYRRRAEQAVEEGGEGGRVRVARVIAQLHAGERRRGPQPRHRFLYDPQRKSEVRFIDAWDEALRARPGSLRAATIL